MCCNCCIYFPCWSSRRNNKKKKKCSVLSRRNRAPADSELQFWICSSSTCATSQQENSSCNFRAVTELNKWSPLVECRWSSDWRCSNNHCSPHEHNCHAYVTMCVHCVFQLWRRRCVCLGWKHDTKEEIWRILLRETQQKTAVTFFMISFFYMNVDFLMMAIINDTY